MTKWKYRKPINANCSSFYLLLLTFCHWFASTCMRIQREFYHMWAHLDVCVCELVFCSSSKANAFSFSFGKPFRFDSGKLAEASFLLPTPLYCCLCCHNHCWGSEKCYYLYVILNKQISSVRVNADGKYLKLQHDGMTRGATFFTYTRSFVRLTHTSKCMMDACMFWTVQQQ